ncbi:hypothetical protein Gotri_007910 [Gossypium trilobum]|uniref:Fold protein n=1 Tax=Gossypium trilobum TaxID=34281 RepID=A0A7J9EHS7_9ROSI|nr:hypothetical protein [Gossypium trilobum]
MASDESMTVVSSIHDDEYDDIDVGFHPHNLSRLSMCNSSMYTNEDDDDDDDMGMYMSRLSIESFDADVDEEFTDYASESEAQRLRGRRSKDLRKRRVIKGRWVDKEMGCKHEGKNKSGSYYNYSHSNYSGSFSGESEGGVVVITRPKGGKRSLCMDMEEVKACRDLGLELEMPGRVSLSGSAIDNTSSGGNSPIANWCISSPGDDPRDVKARLKVWAQAVALASTSRHCS